MKLFRSLLSLLFLLFVVSMKFAHANSIMAVKTGDLFDQADVVVAVEVLSGLSNSYDVVVYKAKVTDGFKGAKTGETIFFGPFLNVEVGGEYLLFMKKQAALSPLRNGEPNYGILPVFNRLMYDGYSELKMDYTCVFEGKDTSDQCDYAVFLNPSQILLPDFLTVFPKHELGTETNYKGWVRRGLMIAHLRDLATQSLDYRRQLRYVEPE